MDKPSAGQTLTPCTCGHRGLCTMCRIVTEMGFDAAVTAHALAVTERACGLKGANE